MYHRPSTETKCHQQKVEKCNRLSSSPAHAQLSKLNHLRKCTRLSSVKRAESLGTRLVNIINTSDYKSTSYLLIGIALKWSVPHAPYFIHHCTKAPHITSSAVLLEIYCLRGVTMMNYERKRMQLALHAI